MKYGSCIIALCIQVCIYIPQTFLKFLCTHKRRLCCYIGHPCCHIPYQAPPNNVYGQECYAHSEIMMTNWYIIQIWQKPMEKSRCFNLIGLIIIYKRNNRSYYEAKNNKNEMTEQISSQTKTLKMTNSTCMWTM